jgi:hypothetical protein
MVKKIVFPKINNFTSEEVKQKFLEILKSIKLNIKYVRLVNIRESLTGLRFYIKTKNFFAIGEYDCIANIIMASRQRINTKNYISFLYKRNDLVNKLSYFVKVE